MEYQLTFNLFQIILAWIGFFTVGSLWFGPVFGKLWMKAVGLTEEETQTKDFQKKGLRAMLLCQPILLITIYVISTIVNSFATSNLDALGIAIVLWFSAPFLITFNQMLFENRSPLYLRLTLSYHLTWLVVVTQILFLMK